MIDIKNKLDFIPVGFQYYRAPTPERHLWESDLKKISEDGFNVVKYWVQWRWNMPQKDKCYFDDIDELMDLAQKYKLKVILNLAFDVAPAWLFSDYDDLYMITNSGEILYSRSTEYRQIGGVPGPCFHHLASNQIKERFLEEVVKRYVNHEALYCWDLWNEPELTVGIKRTPQLADLVCYCEHTKRQFSKWLKNKYQDITHLNQIWGRNYQNFEQVEMPRNHGTTFDMIDWRLFHIQTITNEYVSRVSVVKKHDQKHQVMCHTVPMPLFNSITGGSDDWALAEHSDLFGNSVGSNPVAANILTSAAKGKVVINSEIHAVVGKTLVAHTLPTEQDLIRHIFTPMAKGIKGFLFWQYRPEVLGHEAPAWGSVNLEGNNTPWHEKLININHKIQEFQDIILNGKTQVRNVGVYYEPKDEIYIWNTTTSLDIYNQSFLGAYYLLHDLNYNVEIIREKDLDTNLMDNIKVMYLPSFCLTSDRIIKKIKQWISKGNIAIFEPLTGLINENNGLHNYVLPGNDLSNILGIKMKLLKSCESMQNSYDSQIYLDQTNEDIIIKTDDGDIVGSKYYAVYELINSNVQVMGYYPDESPAVFKSDIGDGYAITLGSLISYSYNKNDINLNPKYLKKIIDHEIEQDFKSNIPLKVRLDVIASSAEGLIIVENNDNQIHKIDIPYTFNNLFDIIKNVQVYEYNFTIMENEIRILKYTNK